MNKFLLVLLMAGSLHASISSDKEYKLNEYMGGTAKATGLGTLLDEGGQTGLVRDGHSAQQQLVLTYDFSTMGGQSTALSEIHLGGSLPSGSIIQRTWTDTVTSLAGTGASVNIYAQTYSDILTETAITSLTAGTLTEGISTGSTALMKQMSAERGVKMRVFGNALTAGKIKVFIQYVMSE